MDEEAGPDGIELGAGVMSPMPLVVVFVVGEDESWPFDKIPGAGDSLEVDVAPVRIHSGLKCRLSVVAEAVVGNVEDEEDIGIFDLVRI